MPLQTAAAARSSARLGSGQKHAEDGAAFGAIVDLHPAVVILDDADRHGEPEAGAALFAVALLGRVERLEDALAIGDGDADAAVVDLEHDVAAGIGGVEAGAAANERLGRQLEHAARRHGLDGVDAQVEADLL